MTRITVLPHHELCPEGAVLEVTPDTTVVDALLQHGIGVEHACDKVCACTTCHVYIREGFDAVNEPTDDEDDLLDKAWGLEPDSRLSCQVRVAVTDLVVELPRYTINHAKENH